MTNETNIDQDIINQTKLETPKPQGNILLNKLKVIPPEVHKLPSGGLLYKTGELKPEVLNGELEFTTYTALDELDLSSPDMLLDGRAIERVISRCVPGVLKPLELFSKDLDYIMLVLHKVSYGDIYKVPFTHTCKDAEEHTYSLSLSDIIRRAKSIDPTTLSTRYCVDVGVGESTYKVNLRPLRAKHAIDLLQSFDKEKNEDDRRHNLFAIFMFSISDVDGITDLDNILDWLKQIPVQWIDKISKKIEDISNWGVPYSTKSVCEDCGAEIELSVNINPLNFFT